MIKVEWDPVAQRKVCEITWETWYNFRYQKALQCYMLLNQVKYPGLVKWFEKKMKNHLGNHQQQSELECVFENEYLYNEYLKNIF